MYNYFRKYQQLHFKERVPKRDIDPKEVEAFIKSQAGKGKPGEKPKESSLPTSQPTGTTDTKTSTACTVKTNQSVDSGKVSTDPTKVEIPSTTTISPDNTTTNISSSSSSSKVDVPKEKPKTLPISTYNGDTCDTYNWSQGIHDVTIQMKLPEGIKRNNVSIS